MKHRSCQCDTSTVPNLNITLAMLCESLCNNDNDCKGYAIRPGLNICNYYTETPVCSQTPVICTLEGFNIQGNVGKITTQPESDHKGCFIKEKRINYPIKFFMRKTVLDCSLYYQRYTISTLFLFYI